MTPVSEKVQQFFARYPLRQYAKGAIMIMPDDDITFLLYLVQGKVRKYDITDQGDEIIVNIFKSGAFFPMSMAVNHASNKYFYKAEEDSEVRVAPSTEVLAFLQTNPDVMLNLLSRIYHGMEGLFARMVHLMSGTARSRLMYELLIEARRFGTPGGESGIVITVSELDLAARAGLTRETISREMSKLKKRGLIQRELKNICIPDMKALEQALGAEI